jgi:hypothetical protein
MLPRVGQRVQLRSVVTFSFSIRYFL